VIKRLNFSISSNDIYMPDDTANLVLNFVINLGVAITEITI